MEKHIKPHSVLNNYMLALGFQMKNICDEKRIYVNSNSHRQGFLASFLLFLTIVIQ